MNNETKFETYSFTHHDEDNVSINLTFTVPAVGAHISTFYEMCRKFALACGYAEATVEKYFGAWDDDAFTEYMD